MKHEAEQVLKEIHEYGYKPYINQYGSIVYSSSVPLALVRRALDCGQAMFKAVAKYGTA